MGRKTSSNRFDKLADDITGLAVVIIITLLLGLIVYKVAEAVIGQLPAILATIASGLVLLFFYATNQAIRKAINSWLKKLGKNDTS